MLGGGGDSCRVTAGWGNWQGRDHRLRQRFTICKQQTTRCVNEVSLLKQCDKNERPDEVSLHADKRFVCKKKDGDQLYNNAWMCVNVSSKQIKTTNQFWWWWYRNSSQVTEPGKTADPPQVFFQPKPNQTVSTGRVNIALQQVSTYPWCAETHINNTHSWDES